MAIAKKYPNMPTNMVGMMKIHLTGIPTSHPPTMQLRIRRCCVMYACVYVCVCTMPVVFKGNVAKDDKLTM